MKTFCLGICFGIFGFLLSNDVVSTMYYKYDVFEKARMFYIDPSLGISAVILKRCTTESGRNGHGWEIKSYREYYGCNSFQNKLSDLIHGEK